jgi:hypothetical protein
VFISISTRTVELEKKKIENTHQAEWDTKLRTDAGLLELDMSVKASEVRATNAKDRLEKMRAEITAQGEDSEHILNLRGIDSHTRDGLLTIAHDIRQGTLESTMAQTAKAMADRKFVEYKKEALDGTIPIMIEGKTIVKYGAGIMGAKGERSILAKAKSENSAALIEDVKNIQSTMDHSLATDPSALRKMFNGTTVFSEQVAYAIALGKAGTPGMKEFRNLLADLGDGTDGTFEDPSLFQAFKEFIAGESDLVKAGKDIETFVFNKPGSDGKPMTFKQLKEDVGTWVNMSTIAFASMSEIAQEDALKRLMTEKHEAYMEIIDGIRGNPAASGSVKQKIREMFSIYSDQQLKSAKKDNRPLPKPGTYNP